MDLTGIKAGERAKRFYREIKHDVSCSLSTSTINVASGADDNLFNLFSRKTTALRHRGVESRISKNTE